ncbi:hypothetical protein Bca52824_017612 [Brassica carinata]|uniref:Uncharacterized protein n=1 Tax=Brassica carinata TaxID=52824 RepID=A0A8X7VPE6_BRACI|nr:hypothetical protein Bca52824_017612 [Brassica carinata]
MQVDYYWTPAIGCLLRPTRFGRSSTVAFTVSLMVSKRPRKKSPNLVSYSVNLESNFRSKFSR